MTISFDVNIVNIDTNKYKIKKNVDWLDLALFDACEAKYLKKPTSSKNIDKIVIEINSINIFSGFTLELEVKLFNTLSNDMHWNRIINKAPNKPIIQYVFISLFFIFIFEKNKIDKISDKQVNIAIIIVASILFMVPRVIFFIFKFIY